MAQARYTLHIPQRHKLGHEMPHALTSVRNALTAAGLSGRMVIRSAEADHGNAEPQGIDMVIVDGEDHPTTDNAIKAVVEGYKGLSNHAAIYVTKTPIETWLV